MLYIFHFFFFYIAKNVKTPKMVLGFGCVHPAGEKADYDGFFYKQNEMESLAKQLVGKPLCVEHLDCVEDAGKIRHAWVGPTSKELYAIFETNDASFSGMMAKNLIQGALCTDLSLGHNVTVDKGKGRVVEKEATEVSICEKGARARTHIYAVEMDTTQKKKKKKKGGRHRV